MNAVPVSFGFDLAVDIWRRTAGCYVCSRHLFAFTQWRDTETGKEREIEVNRSGPREASLGGRGLRDQDKNRNDNKENS